MCLVRTSSLLTSGERQSRRLLPSAGTQYGSPLRVTAPKRKQHGPKTVTFSATQPHELSPVLGITPKWPCVLRRFYPESEPLRASNSHAAGIHQRKIATTFPRSSGPVSHTCDFEHMTRRQPSFTQAELTRALRAAQKAGLTVGRFVLEPTKLTVFSGEPPVPKGEVTPLTEWRARRGSR